ncbi:MAG: ATP-binding cassette domain-containing protein [Acidimicrobiia bacterium]|nr:ATP-binding cassette domain-containing protein [Acidimicrobiia bacterium]MYC57982.1 ATP-binding cassette domain-containing protein [Acidimicrobiia bacterium]MYG94670.1 ATP-binding cassette domain-containing protein [Acidimicrobiia bacterium]MYI31069.1 ATP-binding cassette domain-containing protein [Acidimicrobiia bacterium]
MAGCGKAHLRGSTALLSVEDLVVEFPAGRRTTIHAVSGISFDVLEGETLGVVGESGCGKSATARAIMQLPPPNSGSVIFDGEQMTQLSKENLRRSRTRMQMIFQDPISSLNPRRKVNEIVAEGLSIWHTDSDDIAIRRVHAMLEAVGLDPKAVENRRPHQFSSGQCQRICIARAMILDPKLIICDEPVSALDVSVQAQILNLLTNMKKRYGLTLVFIAHDLAVVKNVSDRVVVMYLGKICEVADPDRLYTHAAHPYTDILLASVPKPDPHMPIPKLQITGELPSPINPPSGCRFRTRCTKAQDVCAVQEPSLQKISSNHFVACHFPNETSTHVAI